MWETSSEEENNENQLINGNRRRRVFRPRVNCQFPSTYEFNERFRLSAETLQQIMESIGGRMQSPTDRNQALSPKLKICVALHWLGTGAQYHAIGDMHGVSKGSVCRAVHSVVTAVNESLFLQVVKWPENTYDVVNRFYEMAHMPCVIGCIDGTHIKIEKPYLHEVDFVNRHGNHSLNCLVVCGPDCLFYYVNSSWPGSAHDSRVLRNTNLYRRLEGGWRPIPNAIILGDSGYPLLDWLITPTGRNLHDPAVIRFNRAHKSTRRIVENSLGILKSKFPCLNYLRIQPMFASEVFKCCTTLCNLSRARDNTITNEENEEADIGPEDDTEPPSNALNRLSEIINYFR